MTETVSISITNSGGADFSRARRGHIGRSIGAYLLLMKATNNILFLTFLTVFLKTVGANSLPWMYVVGNVCFISLQFAFSEKLHRWEGYHLLSALALPSMIFSILAGIFIEGAYPPLLFGGLICAMLLDLFSGQSFSNMANSLLTIQESKRILPGVYAAGSAGYILSGIMMKFILDFAGIRGLLIMNGLLLIFQESMLRRLEVFHIGEIAPSNFVPPVGASNTGIEPAEPADPAANHLNQPLARLLISSSFLILFTKYFVDFLFAGAASSHFPTSQKLASFMGIFGACTDFTVVGLQTVLMNWVFCTFPIGRILTVVPILLGLLCLSASFSLSFMFIVFIQFMVLVNTKNFTVPASTILLGAIPRKERSLVRRDISVTTSIAIMLAGGALLLARDRLPKEALFAICAVLFLAMAWVHSRLDQAYASSLRKTLSEQSASLDTSLLHSLSFLSSTNRASRMQELLEHSDPEIRKAILRDSGLLQADEVESLLLPHFQKERDPQCLALLSELVLERLGLKALSHLESLLASSKEARLISDLLEALGRTRSGEAAATIVEPFLRHDHHRIRASAVIAMIRLARREDRLQPAFACLAQMGRMPSPLFRASAAAAMGELALPLFLPALETIAWDPDITAGNTAMNGVAKVGTPQAMAILEALCGHPDPKSAEIAGDLLRASSQGNLERIRMLMEGLSGLERQKLARGLKKIKHERVLDLLGDTLALENPLVRDGLARLLQRADAATLEVLKECLAPLDGPQPVISLTPIWNRARLACLTAMPVWSEALHFLSLEIFRDRERWLSEQRASLPMLRQIILEAAALEIAARPAAPHNAASGRPVRAPQEPEGSTSDGPGEKVRRLERLQARWTQRTDICTQLVLLTHSDPPSMLTACEGIKNADIFKRSLSQEILETNLDREVSALLVPLIQKELFFKIQGKSPSWEDFARERALMPPEPIETRQLEAILETLNHLEDSSS